MKRRTTLEIDEQLLARAQHALGCTTMRATVEEALRRATERLEADGLDRSARQRGYLERLSSRVDPEVLDSEQMWR